MITIAHPEPSAEVSQKEIEEIIEVMNLFVLRFYGPVNPMGSCRARSVYLTTRLLGRRGDERKTQGRQRNRNESEETEEIKTFSLYPYLLQG